MPLLRITYQRGAITDSQKVKLAEELTPVLLVGEVGTDSQDGRDASFVIFHELDARSEWFVGGKPDLEAPGSGSRPKTLSAKFQRPVGAEQNTK